MFDVWSARQQQRKDCVVEHVSLREDRQTAWSGTSNKSSMCACYWGFTQELNRCWADGQRHVCLQLSSYVWKQSVSAYCLGSDGNFQPLSSMSAKSSIRTGGRLVQCVHGSGTRLATFRCRWKSDFSVRSVRDQKCLCDKILVTSRKMYQEHRTDCSCLECASVQYSCNHCDDTRLQRLPCLQIPTCSFL